MSEVADDGKALMERLKDRGDELAEELRAAEAEKKDQAQRETEGYSDPPKSKKTEPEPPIELATYKDRGRKTSGEEKKQKSEAPDDEDAETKKARANARATARVQIAALNKKHFVINNIGGKCLIGEFVPSSIDPKCTILSLQAPTAFATRYGNQKVGIVGEDGKNTHQELGRHWLKHGDRRSYEGMDLVPNGPPILPGNRLNLWRGFGVEPKQGDYPLIKAHLREVLANGSRPALEYIWRWTAWAV